jgi:hypothetical protein
VASQGQGWFESTGIFSGANEGSMGESLSRFLASQIPVSSVKTTELVTGVAGFSSKGTGVGGASDTGRGRNPPGHQKGGGMVQLFNSLPPASGVAGRRLRRGNVDPD